MEMSCESVRHGEDSRRPNSCKFVELHVLFVPGEQWNAKLNKVPAETTESFISAGFIRVYPDITLKTLRRELDALFGTERNISKYSFLKCVGRSLALVKRKQEGDLKVKTFAPPYAAQPELYLLPTMETDISFCSQSFTPDTSSSSPDQQIYYQPPKTCSLPMGTKEHVKFPHIPQCSQQPPPTSVLEEEEEEEEDEQDEEDNQSCISSEEGNDEEALCSIRRAEEESCRGKPQNQRALQLVSLKKALEDDPVKPYRQGNLRKNKYHRDRDSRAAESLEDRDSGFSLADRVEKSKDVLMLKSIRNNPASGVSESPAVMSRPVHCTSPPPGLAAISPPIFHTNREAVIKEIKLVKEERKQLEWIRQELLRKGKDLIAQNRHRRNQARDSWKKKYFETKKATTPLEDNQKTLRQELDTFYNKLLHQLQARDNRGRPRRQGRTSVKNELIIQIMTENYEIDNLKRKIEDAKMKLITEIKLRMQAATELRALKAELAQKKSQSSHPALMGNTGWARLFNGS
ncbi:spermatogenesis-associated protein 1 isoform X2 [Melanotaenia boesemani]|uniref:spermatogenesis-associated protein 1 isoform X2 n=1 Tax=Melanotaenia boesemani TaxID=1250792 RepID=UPI001C03BAE9|nr:spermatogenesis-associated protein 1 isoform X2 [Melanotaenia boesemani]